MRLPNKGYGPGTKLKYHEPEFDTRLVIGAHARHHHYTVRGVPVSPVGETTVDHRNICYRYCVFPDGRRMLVNEGNIRSTKIKGASWPVPPN